MVEITSKSNERLKDLIALAGSKKLRDEKNIVLVDGVKLCLDAVATGHSLIELWVTESALERYSEEASRLYRSASEVFVLKDHASQRISDLKTPQGIWGIFTRPEQPDVSSCFEYRRVLGICNVQNPENAGAMIRTASALGFDASILSSECSDIWSPRAIRAGALSQMNLPCISVDDFGEALKELSAMGFHSYASSLNPAASKVEDICVEEKAFLIIGNEGHGIPIEIIEKCDKSIYIPMANDVESLNANAAAAILMWVFRK